MKKTRKVDPQVARLRTQCAVYARQGRKDELGKAQRDLRFVQLKKAVCAAVDAAPPLTPEQRAVLIAILNPSSSGDRS